MKRFLTILLFFAALLACKKEDENQNNSGGSSDKPTGTITVVGTVKGNDGTLLEGVVVSDGVHCVKTDAKGKYQLPADLTSTDFVFVSTPSGWSAPVVSGQAVFYKALKGEKKGSDGKYNVDFSLNRISNPNRYTIFIFADPQPRRHTLSDGKVSGGDNWAYKSLDCCDDMYRDMKELKATITDRPVYGIVLGDIVHQDLTLLDEHKAGMATTGISTYNIIGNHDQGHVLNQSDEESCKGFEAKLGPANYSFNLGGMHFLMLDNMISVGEGKYSDDECATGLTDKIWEFVQNDLALVPKTTPLMVCAHSPMMRKDPDSDRSGPHLAQLRTLLKSYPKAYVWAGHSHSMFNYAPKDEKIESHTLSRVTGTLWTNEYLGSNGSPRGYLVFDYDNGDINWKFHPIPYQSGKHLKTMPDYTYRDWTYDASNKAVLKPALGGGSLDDNYQMQIFAPGVYEDYYVYVNVFMWDEQWENPKFDGAQMKRVTNKDFKYSYAEWTFTSYYYYSQKDPKNGYYSTPDKNNCFSMFRLYTDKSTGTHTVTVKDRFGNNYSSTITW